MTTCIACYISNKFVYSISLSTNSPDEGPLLETLRIEYFYLFQIVASENPSLGIVNHNVVRCLSKENVSKFTMLTFSPELSF